jgi:hypothetical protein
MMTKQNKKKQTQPNPFDNTTTTCCRHSPHIKILENSQKQKQIIQD